MIPGNAVPADFTVSGGVLFIAPPFRQVEFDIMYGHGISKTGELLDLGAKAGIVEKSGSWFSYDGQRLGQGRESAKQYLEANKDVAAAIEAAIRASAGLLSAGLTVAGDEPTTAED